MQSADAADQPPAQSDSRTARSAERDPRNCIACAEPITEIIEARPEYCFVCAVHVVCACKDES